MAYLDRDGVRIFYQISGGSGVPAGGGVLAGGGGIAGGVEVPMLLSHGFAGSSRMWQSNVGALAAALPVITWDMRGHGRSDSPERQELYTRAACVADMAALLDVTGTGRAVLCGLSLGGYVSLSFYLAHPERVAALVLCDTGPGYRSRQARQEWNDRAIEQAGRLERGGLAALGPADRVHHSSAAGLARAARGMLTQWDASVIESLPSIAVPTLVLVGSRDQPFIGAANYMAVKIPGAEHVVIENAGHVSNVDEPARFNAAVLRFLRQARFLSASRSDVATDA